MPLGRQDRERRTFMAEKKRNLERYSEKGQKKLKKKIKNLHPATKAVAVICLILGIAIGAGVCLLTFQNDRFVLKGETQFSLKVGDEPYTYREEGVEAVCFGMDVSGKSYAVPSQGITVNEDGSFTIPTDKEGVYTITYTVDAFKFGEKAPNGQIKRIRVFTVDVAETDGRGEQAEEVAG